jgi:DNA polymerase-3 subunit beta
MQLTIMQRNLKAGLSIVSRAVAGKSTLPVLGHVLLDARSGALKLVATNLEVGITHLVDATVEERGAVTLPAKLLSDIVSALPNDVITLTLNAKNQSVRLECGRFTTNIKGMDWEEFPSVPSVADRTGAIELDAGTFAAAVKKVAFAAAEDGTRPVLAGVYVRAKQIKKDKRITLAAADGFVLATTSFSVEELPFEGDFIIPARAMIEMALVAEKTEGQIALISTGHQVTLSSATTEVVSRLIDGKFPDFERIIPTSHTTRAVAARTELDQAITLARPFAADTKNAIKVSFTPGANTAGSIVVSANADEIGGNTGAIEAEVTGAEMMIGLNVKFVEEVVDALGTPKIAIEATTALAPVVFRPADEGAMESLVVVMPMSLR